MDYLNDGNDEEGEGEDGDAEEDGREDHSWLTAGHTIVLHWAALCVYVCVFMRERWRNKETGRGRETNRQRDKETKNRSDKETKPKSQK